MELYHGSDRIISKPLYGGGRPYNDYGPGFYCTRNLELAYEWACTDHYTGFANKYVLDDTGLVTINLNSRKYHILNWLAVLLDNRIFDIAAPLPRQAKKYILDNFLLDYKSSDILVGYRADDSYFSFARAFLNNTITLEQLGRAMHLGKLGEQVVIRSVRAYEALMYLGAAPAIRGVWYARRMARDKAARDAFRAVQKETPLLDAVYIVDIIREKWQNDDPRIQ